MPKKYCQLQTSLTDWMMVKHQWTPDIQWPNQIPEYSLQGQIAWIEYQIIQTWHERDTEIHERDMRETWETWERHERDMRETQEVIFSYRVSKNIFPTVHYIMSHSFTHSNTLLHTATINHSIIFLLFAHNIRIYSNINRISFHYPNNIRYSIRSKKNIRFNTGKQDLT